MEKLLDALRGPWSGTAGGHVAPPRPEARAILTSFLASHAARLREECAVFVDEWADKHAASALAKIDDGLAASAVNHQYIEALCRMLAAALRSGAAPDENQQTERTTSAVRAAEPDAVPGPSKHGTTSPPAPPEGAIRAAAEAVVSAFRARRAEDALSPSPDEVVLILLSHLGAPAKWTKEPNVSGYYWIRPTPAHEPHIAQVVMEGDEGAWWTTGTADGLVKDCGYEFCGPLPPPAGKE
ncbi:MAG TPA: hypothetical protein VJP77_05795 [Planctomycetota bacterium]|nr:hypothetical protein [Planctomycetota bacterium]